MNDQPNDGQSKLGPEFVVREVKLYTSNSATASSCHVSEKRDYKEHQEDEEKNLRYTCGGDGDTAESQYSGDQCYH